jgi:hypothetical protein
VNFEIKTTIEMKIYFNSCLFIFFFFLTDMHAQNLQFLWAKRLGSKAGDSGYAIAVDKDGNAYSTGSFSQTSDFDPGQDSFLLTSEGQRDIYISKLDEDGNFLWAKQIRGVSSDNAYAMTLDPNGYIYITGNFRDTADFNPTLQHSFLYGRKLGEVYLAKYDFDGNFIWVQKVTRGLDTLGSNVAYSVSVDPFGNAIVLGKFWSPTDFDPGTPDEIISPSGDNDIFLAKYDASGNFTWALNFGGPDEQEPYALEIDGQGNIYCTGNFTNEVDFDPGQFTHILTSQDSSYDAFVLKLNSSGEFQWVNHISGTGAEYANTITVDQDGNSYTGGSYSGLTDFNYGSDPVLLYNDSMATGNTDAFILALDVDGNHQWVKRISGPGEAEVYDITDSPGAQGGLYLVGSFSGEMHLDDMEIPPINSNNSSFDIFYGRLYHNGQFSFLGAIGGTVFEFSQAIAVETLNVTPAIYSTGFFSGTCDFDPGANEYLLSSGGSSDIYVLKLEDFLSGTKETLEPGLNFEINPNPVTTELEVKIPSVQSAQIKILNSLGMEIKSLEPTIENEMVRLDVSAIPSGIYFLQLKINNQVATRKFIIAH